MEVGALRRRVPSRPLRGTTGCDGGGSDAEDDHPSVDPPVAKFHFDASATPNIRDKVMWQATSRAWRATARLQSARETLPHDVAVNASLPREDYLKAKLAAYWEAVDWWNTNDKSTRHCIPGRVV